MAFPNGMVDRIAPATGERERAITRQEFGIEDAWPVFCEDFIQWVVEDRFPAGRPAFEEAGVAVRRRRDPLRAHEDPHPERWARDHRLSLGAHGHPLRPRGHGRSLVRAFLTKVETEEILPILPPVPDTDLGDYFQLIVRRCDNPKIGDTIRRLCLDGSNRQPKFIVPSIADRLDRGLPVDRPRTRECALVPLLRRPNRQRHDHRAERPQLGPPHRPGRGRPPRPAAWLAMRDIYGGTADAPAFRDSFAGWLRALWADGTAATLRRYLDGGM